MAQSFHGWPRGGDQFAARFWHDDRVMKKPANANNSKRPTKLELRTGIRAGLERPVDPVGPRST
jgi:hypothetical protein